jgi:hypothetical protein
MIGSGIESRTAGAPAAAGPSDALTEEAPARGDTDGARPEARFLKDICSMPVPSLPSEAVDS